MEAKLVSQLLADAGIRAELIFEGPAAECPHCMQWGTCSLNRAA